jgi:UDP-N-acetylglucosamine 4,6-dehydratase
METLLIIGGTGSLGHCFIKQLGHRYKIIIISRDENKQWAMKKLFPSLCMILCDIRERDRIEQVILRCKPNKIIIAAALKHIDICENNIDECILTNILGIQNVINAVVNNVNRGLLTELDSVVFTSTDKATSPVNAYGMCKSVCERLMAEKSLFMVRPKFISVRYGNVLYSRGSIFSLYKEIAMDKTREYFPITDEKMTRFFMKLEDSVDLIMKAIQEGESGDTFIPKIPSYRILDIATEFSLKYNKPVKNIGIRPGEKLHECLINESEKHRTIQKNDVFIIKPCYINFQAQTYFSEYTSATDICNDKEKIRELIELELAN